MRIRTLATLAGVILLAGACTDARLIDDVSKIKPKESGFKANLQTEYITLAKAELDEGDIFDTGIFARRAEAAAMGKDVDPDILWDRDLTKKNKASLFKERERLMKALDGGGRSQQPGFAARAQAQFDCWAQELEENNQPRDIQRCRIGYMEAMREMADAMKPAPKPMAKALAKPKMKAKAKRKAASFKMPFVVYFDFDSTTISDMDSVRTLTDAAKAAKKGKSTRIQVTGHTDTSGNADYNAKLAERRAIVVDEALIALGINGLTIERSSTGETELEVETGDDVRKDANRRVVIIVH